MKLFWFLWGWDALIALVFVVFFVWGLSDGTVSSFNIVLWLGILAVLGGVLGGSSWLRNAGHQRVANLVLLSLAIPGFLFALFFLVLIIAQPRWN
jgi:hypothetical protein